MTTKVHIASSRSIGDRCKDWVLEQDFANVKLVEMDECEVFISVMYDSLVPEKFIRGRRCYNFHPGLLPGYRGAGAFSWALINQEDVTGITLHVIEKDMDSGPIILRCSYLIRPEDTAGTLFDIAMDTLFTMFQTTFMSLVTGSVSTFNQDESRARIYPRASLKGQADLTRFVRAFTFPGKGRAFYINHKGVKIELEW